MTNIKGPIAGTQITLLVVLLGILFGCSQGKRPFLMVQFCLAGQSDITDLKSHLESIARQEHMKFVDASTETKTDLETINAPQSTRRDPVIYMGVEGADGIGLQVASMGLPSYQVVVGFSEGSDPSTAHAFADAVVQKLSTRWHLKTVPAGSGAVGLKTCD